MAMRLVFFYVIMNLKQIIIDSFRRGEVTEEYIVDMQSADINRFGGQPSIVLQPLSNNTQIQKTKYYDNEVSTRTPLVNYSDIACGRFDLIKIINDVFNFI